MLRKEERVWKNGREQKEKTENDAEVDADMKLAERNMMFFHSSYDANFI